MPRGEAAGLREELRAHGKTVVFTNGCFDLLHAGHVRYLEEARLLGDALVVGLNSDRSVSRLKGTGRPLIPQEDRARLVAALEAVTVVVIFDEETPVKTIEAVRPDIHVKGGDYLPDDLPEAETVRRLGGAVRILPFLPGRSTTALVQKIQSPGPQDG